MTRLSKQARAMFRDAIKKRVERELPEDEHDHTADWVYDVAIDVTLALTVKALEVYRKKGRR